MHALKICASGRFADNLCARRPPTDTHITSVAIPDTRCLGLRKLEVPEPRCWGRLKNLTKTSLRCRAPSSVAVMQCSKRSSRGGQRSVTMTRDQHLEPRISAWGFELVRVTEAAARAVWPHIGRGDKHAVDAAGTEAMCTLLNRQRISYGFCLITSFILADKLRSARNPYSFLRPLGRLILKELTGIDISPRRDRRG